jgi:Xaa-Pro aminopeptidase
MSNFKNLGDCLQAKIQSEEAHSVIISFLPNIRWGTGFSGSNGLLLVGHEAMHFVTDGRYRDQAEGEVPGGIEVHIASNGLIKCVDEEGLLDGQARVLFQSDHVTVNGLASWKDRFPETEFVPAANLLTEQQGVKSGEEVDAIRAAQSVTDAVFTELVEWIRPGVSEQEVAAEIVYRHMKRGAARMSFDPIVASGPNGALPHARPTDHVVQKGELVVIDMGCFLHGYASDMTRTIAIGDPGDEARAGYAAVREAQEAALEAAEAGMKASDLDGVARTVLEDHGLGDEFSHGLGHGVGLQIHEWPRVSKNSDTTLPAGAVVTIEPGVYVAGAYGVRIEDIIVLREGGSDNLTSSTKELITID